MLEHPKKEPFGDREINEYYELGFEEGRLFLSPEGVLERGPHHGDP